MKKSATAKHLRLSVVALFLAFCLAAALPVCAATGGSISGTISDPSGAVIPGALLKLVNTGQQTTYRVTTDKQGFYSFPDLPVGNYQLTISDFACRVNVN